MFCNIFFHKNTVGECETPSLLQKEKRGYAKSDVSKRLFPDMGKITNTCLMVDHATAQMEVDRKCSTIIVPPPQMRMRPAKPQGGTNFSGGTNNVLQNEI